MIRAAQVRTLSLAEKNYQKINDDLDHLFSQASIHEHAPAILFAQANAGLVSEHLPVEITITRSFDALISVNSSQDLTDILSEELIDHLPNAVWGQGMRVHNREQIKLFVKNFSKLSQNNRDAFLSASFATEGSSHLIDQSWFSECAKPKDRRNWEEVLSFLDEILMYPHISDSICFLVAIARARAVVYADYLKLTDKAITIIEDLPILTNPDALFLVNYTKGCFASDAGRSEEADIYFTEAENIEGSGFAFYRVDNKKRLAIEESRLKNWDIAKLLCIDVIHLFGKNEGKDLFTWHRYEMFGELAFIHWYHGEFKKAFAAMYGYVMGLIKEKDIEDVRYKEVFLKAGHGLGWFASVSDLGIPPAITLNGEEYTSPYAGLFGIPREHLAEYSPPLGFSKAIMLTQLARFAGGVGLLRMAWKIYKLSLEYCQFEEMLDNKYLVTIYPDLAYLETVFGNPQYALEYAIKAINFLAIGKASLRFEDDIPNKKIKIESVAEEPTQEDYQTAEKHLLYFIFGPLLTNLIGTNKKASEISTELRKWEEKILKFQSDLLYVDEWLMVIRYFDDLIHFWKDGKEINQDFEVFDFKSIFELFIFLLNSSRPNTKLKDSFHYQGRVVVSLLNYDRFARYLIIGIGRFIHKFWLNIALTRRFALKNPQILLENLRSISPNQGGVTIANVMTEVSYALGVKLSIDTKEKLGQVKAISELYKSVLVK